jgi:hypothetical protein
MEKAAPTCKGGLCRGRAAPAAPIQSGNSDPRMLFGERDQLRRGLKMNSDQLKGNWKQFVGKAKEKWGQLTDDDWKVVG